jgi:hypothetical protein
VVGHHAQELPPEPALGQFVPVDGFVRFMQRLRVVTEASLASAAVSAQDARRCAVWSIPSTAAADATTGAALSIASFLEALARVAEFRHRPADGDAATAATRPTTLPEQLQALIQLVYAEVDPRVRNMDKVTGKTQAEVVRKVRVQCKSNSKRLASERDKLRPVASSAKAA